MPISQNKLNQYAKYMEEAGVKEHCPCCYRSMWTPPVEMHAYDFFIPCGNPEGNEDMLLVPTLVLYCQSCGFVRQHAVHILEEQMAVVKEAKATPQLLVPDTRIIKPN